MPLQVAGVADGAQTVTAKKKDETSAWFKGLNAAEGCFRCVRGGLGSWRGPFVCTWGLAGGGENVCRSSTPAIKQTHAPHQRRDAPSPSPADVTLCHCTEEEEERFITYLHVAHDYVIGLCTFRPLDLNDPTQYHNSMNDSSVQIQLNLHDPKTSDPRSHGVTI